MTNKCDLAIVVYKAVGIAYETAIF